MLKNLMKKFLDKRRPKLVSGPQGRVINTPHPALTSHKTFTGCFARQSRKGLGENGFTLAEVLITLGIIGVVAAMTIPTLMSKYRGDVAVTRLKKFYSSINQAIEHSETVNGDKKDWDAIGEGQDTLNWYNKYLKDYLVTLKVELNTNNTNPKVTVYFADGSLLVFNVYSWQFFPNASDYNTSSDKDRSQCGRKFFDFYYYNDKGLEPYKWNWSGTRSDLLNNADFGCNNTSKERAYCTALIQFDGWKIPDDYPINF